jgi:hypothetical protein
MTRGHDLEGITVHLAGNAGMGTDRAIWHCTCGTYKEVTRRSKRGETARNREATIQVKATLRFARHVMNATR